MIDGILKIHRPRKDGVGSSFLGLKITIFLRIQILKIETDSQETLNLLKQNTNEFLPLAVLISNCTHLLSLFEEHKLLKISKKNNFCGDLLAKSARKSKSPYKRSVKRLPVSTLPTCKNYKTDLCFKMLVAVYLLCLSLSMLDSNLFSWYTLK